MYTTALRPLDQISMILLNFLTVGLNYSWWFVWSGEEQSDWYSRTQVENSPTTVFPQPDVLLSEDKSIWQLHQGRFRGTIGKLFHRVSALICYYEFVFWHIWLEYCQSSFLNFLNFVNAILGFGIWLKQCQSSLSQRSGLQRTGKLKSK